MAVAGSFSDHGPQELRKFPADVPVFGPEPPYECLFYVTPEDARRLMMSRKATFLRLTKHIRGIRILADTAKKAEKPTSIRGTSLGKPTSSDSIDNPTGCWTFSSPGKEAATSKTYRALPSWAREILFRTILLECVTKAA